MAGSGRVCVTVGKELGAIEAPEAAQTWLWVASDIVLPDGETRPDAAIETLFANAGFGDVSLDDISEIRIARREGWIRSWGLPRPTLTVIQAGSVIVLASPLDIAALAKLAGNGLGSRQAEGFGHVLVNAALLSASGKSLNVNSGNKDHSSGGKTEQEQNPVKAEILRLVSEDHIATIEASALTALLEAYAEKAVVSREDRKAIFGWSEAKPNMSQLGNLRNAASSLNALGLYSKQVKASGREKDWGVAAVFDKTLALFGIGETPADRSIWEALDIPGDELAKCLIKTSPQAALADADTILKAARLLLHAGMRAHKRGLEKADNRALQPAETEA